MEEFTIDFESLIRTPGIIPFCTIIYLSVHGVHFIMIIVVYVHICTCKIITVTWAIIRDIHAHDKKGIAKHVN